MHRKVFIALCVSTALSAAPVFAQTHQDKFVKQLQSQGFVSMTVTKTWLGRTRIVASSKTHNRELIYNTRTGEILRDYWEELDTHTATTTTTDLLNPNASNEEDGSDSDGSSGGSTDSGSSGGDSGSGDGDSGSSGGGDSGSSGGGDSGSSGGGDSGSSGSGESGSSGGGDAGSSGGGDAGSSGGTGGGSGSGGGQAMLSAPDGFNYLTAGLTEDFKFNPTT